ncbi:DUF4221 family protein [Mongoliitalea daihaiensis]|uniref:DUF4221 family protein n=1 Tax=Mongoliitalea daihaiensis TaxID=2782006 RepID=UPI001F44D327|nr:DUF4221 family protein [Mongoliitalea daihaiensis]UJP66354.1 DUF4221 family protein [Mongoliitalea daihaiensis]
MRNLTFPLFLILCLAACATKSTENILTANTPNIFLDTVYMESGEDVIFFTFNGLGVSDLSEDGRYLYNFDFKTPALEVFDLETYTLSERILFEKEGPNGVGTLVYDFNRIGRSLFFLGSRDFNYGLFNLKAEKIRNIPFEGLEKIWGKPVSMNQGEVLNESPLMLGGHFTMWSTDGGQNETQLGVWNIDEEKMDTYQMGQWFDVAQFESTMTSASYDMPVKSYWVTVKAVHGRMLASTNVTSDLMVYHEGAFEKKSISHQLIPSQNSFKLSPQYDSQKAFENDFKKSQESINFSHPVWDATLERFYRFAYQAIPSSEESYKVYLVAMNKNFELLWEMEVPVLRKRPNFHFVKDGEIWMFENIQDEVAFIRIRMED